ncbi:uncharacterized protein LOC112094206 [Morus notabilis]|uniref:uncharacterized protein LOC112094206 n=1 Tax=Morus notabilis TaxID=981085 RepID=UPI000CED55AB|nr:uncharacterized protein LOC112094206 [Morus notabilis]
MSCTVYGIGSIRLKMWDGTEKVLQEVRYIPNLKRNLISLSSLDQKGYCYKAKDGVLKVIKGALLVMKGVLKQGLYILQGSTISGEVDAVTSSKKDETELGHKRLGHMSIKGLQELGKQGLLDAKQISDLNFYETCVLGKSQRLRFVSATHKTKGTLDYIHSDLWGFSKNSEMQVELPIETEISGEHENFFQDQGGAILNASQAE